MLMINSSIRSDLDSHPSPSLSPRFLPNDGSCVSPPPRSPSFNPTQPDSQPWAPLDDTYFGYLPPQSCNIVGDKLIPLTQET